MADSIKELKQTILDYDDEQAAEVAKKIVAENGPLLEAIDAMGEAMRDLGAQFQAMEVFLPELLMATDAFKAAMKVFEPELKKRASGMGDQAPKVIIATVKGDVHGVGKDMVALMMNVEGFEVKDLGVDVDSELIIKEAENYGADIIALSALMSTTIPYQKEVIDFLEAKNLRDKYKIMVGGGSTTNEWAEQIGADGYSKDAISAVALAKRLVAGK